MKRNIKTREDKNLVKIVDLPNDTYFRIFSDGEYNCDCVFCIEPMNWDVKNPRFRDAQIIEANCQWHQQIDAWFRLDEVVYVVKR